MIMKSDILFIQFLKKGKVSRMLALSRKKDEAIIINDDVEVTVIEIKGDQVKRVRNENTGETELCRKQGLKY